LLKQTRIESTNSWKLTSEFYKIRKGERTYWGRCYKFNQR
jgi:hypothetical protein